MAAQQSTAHNPSTSVASAAMSGRPSSSGASATADNPDRQAPCYTQRIPTAAAQSASSVHMHPLLTPKQYAPLSISGVKKANSDPRSWTTRVKRLMTEIQLMTDEPLSNCSASPKGDDLTEWTATLQGPPGTVYEGGTYFLDISFPKDYPYIAPKIRFATKIYHCNINSQGVICIDILQQNWSPALTISKILLSISSLLCECNPEDPLVGSIATLYKTDKEEHDRNARMWTTKYAS